MNTNDDFDLLRRLKTLPRARDPVLDLWPGIEGRLVPQAGRRNSRAWLVGLALAASAALVAVLATRAPDAPSAPGMVQTQPGSALPARTSPTPAVSMASRLVRREAEAITIEYRLALETFAGQALPPELEIAAWELDDSARRIRSALREEPDAVYLLDRLRRTYDQRLKLSQRALLG